MSQTPDDTFNALFEGITPEAAAASAAHGYEEQCLKELIRIIGNDSGHAQMLYEAREASKRFDFSLFEELFPGSPFVMAVGSLRPTGDKPPVVSGLFKKKRDKRILDVFYETKRLISRSRKPLAAFVRTRDIGNIVIHDHLPIVGLDRSEELRLLVPSREEGRFLVIEPRPSFLRLLKHAMLFS